MIDQERILQTTFFDQKCNKVKTRKKETYHLGNLETLNNSWVKEEIKVRIDTYVENNNTKLYVIQLEQSSVK